MAGSGARSVPHPVSAGGSFTTRKMPRRDSMCSLASNAEAEYEWIYAFSLSRSFSFQSGPQLSVGTYSSVYKEHSLVETQMGGSLKDVRVCYSNNDVLGPQFMSKLHNPGALF
jgi:hypothetical protein